MNSRWRWLVLVALAVLAFSAAALRLSSTRLFPRYDEVAYLSVARTFAREGGVASTIRCYVETRCQEDNRPPLFMLLMQPFMDDAPSSLAKAKLVTHATAFLLMLVMFLIVRRRFSNTEAAACVVALCLMPELQDLASRVLHDPLYAATTFAAVFAIAAWQNKGLVAWLAVGGLVGLAFLTKGSGHLLFIPLLATSLYCHRMALVRRPIVYASVAGFVAVAFFLLWRNTKLWGSPFYTINAVQVWLDRWSDVWAWQLDPARESVGLIWYLRRHSILDLLAILAKGAGLTAGTFFYVAGLGFANPVARVVTGVAVWTLACLGLRRRWRSGHRVEVVAVMSTLGVYFAALALAQGGSLGPNARYALPYVALVLPYASHEFFAGVWPHLCAWWVHWVPRVPPATAAMTLASALLLARVVVAAPIFATNPLSYYAVEPHWHETSEWLSHALVPGEKFATSPQSFYSTWDLPYPDTDARWLFKFGTPAPELLWYLDLAHVRKALVDRSLPEFKDYGDKLSAVVDAHGPLEFLHWPRCFADSATPSRFLLYCHP